jgi:hypothetical protein
MKIKTIILLFTPSTTPEYTPSSVELDLENISVKCIKSKSKILSNSSNKKIIIELNIDKSKRYPPRNNKLVNILINSREPYSAKKKNTNITAACSVINPLTNSDSASAKSNGALLVSATEPIKNIIKIHNNGKANHTIFWN